MLFKSQDDKWIVKEGLPVVSEEENWGSDACVSDIKQANNIGDTSIYFIDYYSKASSAEGYQCVYVFKIKDSGLEPTAWFIDKSGEKTRGASVDYSIPDWYFRACDGDGWSRMIHYDAATKTMLILGVSENSMLLSGRYDAYKWDGKLFRYDGMRPYWGLNPSLADYERLESYFVWQDGDKSHLVRIDCTSKGHYRLAMWPYNGEIDMRGTPEIILQCTGPDLEPYSDVKLEFVIPEGGHYSYEGPAKFKRVD